ncbi:MAG: sugar phosphate isomerase/epimerase family protein [Armatimonadota bacterium]
MSRYSRRDCLKLGVALGSTMLGRSSIAESSSKLQKTKGNQMKLGLVTYNIANKWDVPTIIEKCKAIGIEGVELRTTHAHGVEPSLSKAERKEVRQRFEDAGITLWGLGTVCEYHSDDLAVVEQNIETCKAFVLLAEDVGATGVKVRPNGLQLGKGIPEQQTIEQIGLALRKCGSFAAEHGVEIWLEVHGPETQQPSRIRKIIDICDHPSVGVCWNSNPTDVKNGSIRENLELVRKKIKSVHINELWKPAYPWRELFSLLKQSYNRFTLAEIPESADPERVLRYYRALWLELTR